MFAHIMQCLSEPHHRILNGLYGFYGPTAILWDHSFLWAKTGFAYIIYIMISAFADALHIMP